jgi:glycosyltransferase involved in cell wall biosynthesis
MKPRHLCVVDPNVTDDAGHYAGYIASFCKEVQRRGLSVRVLANRDVSPELQTDLGAEPVFRYGLFHRFRRAWWAARIPEPIRSNWAYYADLHAAMRSVDANWIVLVPTIDHRHMLAWGWWLGLRPTRRLPSVVMLLRYNYTEFDGEPRWRPEARWARSALRILEKAGRGRLRIATDSDRLAREYRQLTRLDVEVFPIPHTDDVTIRRTPVGPANPGTVRFVSLGDARTAKGFAVLVEAIKLLHRQRRTEGIEFVLQSKVAPTGQDAARSARDELAGLGLENVHLIDEILTRKTYLVLLHDADVIVIPYSRRLYHSRTSGPFCEALAAGKPVIVTHDTWMSDQLTRFGAGLTIGDGDTGDLARAILEARAHYQQLAEQARSSSAAWIDIHNPVRFVDALLKDG